MTTAALTRDQRWWQLAACSDGDPDAWYVRETDNRGPLSNAQVKRINYLLSVCRRCPVQPQCLAALQRETEAKSHLHRVNQVCAGYWWDSAANPHTAATRSTQ